MALPGPDPSGLAQTKRRELIAFLFLTVVLVPALAVAAVGTVGLSVWTYQIIAGPPGPPSKGGSH